MVRAGAADTVYAWGYNADAELGDGTTTNRSSPVPISALATGVTVVSAGYTHGMAIQNGGVLAWGSNAQGQVGTGSATATYLVPLALSGALASGVTEISAGGYHSLAIKNGAVYSWGQNTFGQVGNGNTTTQTTPLALGGAMASGVTAVAAGGNFSLAIKDGGVYAWGSNVQGQLGDGTNTSHLTPTAITGALSPQSPAATIPASP